MGEGFFALKFKASPTGRSRISKGRCREIAALSAMRTSSRLRACRRNRLLCLVFFWLAFLPVRMGNA
eukprot:7762266-Pyramimonas_sp.AAC.1